MNAAHLLTENELLAVRFYLGDPETAANGPFRGGPKAYNTINALLHPGSSNEKDKAREGRTIRIEDAAQLESYLTLILDVFRAMERYRRFTLSPAGTQAAEAEASRGGTACGFRLDRLSSLERFQADGGRIAGFFSTCKRGFLPQYAHQKADIVLLEVTRAADVPFLDFEAILGEAYAKPEEAELLLPFGMVIREAQQLPLSERENAVFADLNGKPPRGKWRLSMGMGALPERTEAERAALYATVTGTQTVARIRALMEKLTAREALSAQEEAFYAAWKARLQEYVYSGAAELRRA